MMHDAKRDACLLELCRALLLPRRRSNSLLKVFEGLKQMNSSDPLSNGYHLHTPAMLYPPDQVLVHHTNAYITPCAPLRAVIWTCGHVGTN